MDLELPESHRALQASLRDFCEEKVKPYAREWDKDEKFPMEVVQELGQLGVLGMLVPEEYGGAAMDSLAVAVAVEEIARFDGSLALTVASHNGLGTGHMRVFGNDAQKKKYLPKLATGEWLGAWGLTEPGIRLGRRRHADHRREARATLGAQRHQDVHHPGHGRRRLRRARAHRRPRSARRASPRSSSRRARRASAQRAIHGKLGMRSSDTAELILENVEVPDYASASARSTTASSTRCRSSTAAASPSPRWRSASAAARSRVASRYAKDRKAFGKPIAEFQAIQWMLADMQDGARGGAAAGAPRGAAGRRRAALPREASMAKLFASRSGDARLQQGRADPRRLRLHARVPRRALPARREAVRDRRGHERDAAHHHRPRDLQRGLMDTARLRELGLQVREEAAGIEVVLDLEAASLVNPITREFITEVTFQVMGDRLIPIARRRWWA